MCVEFSGEERTGLLLLQGQLSPGALHAVSQRHPELGLLLERHALPSLLDVGERRVGDGVGGGGAADDGLLGSGAQAGAGQGNGGGSEHRVGFVMCRPREKIEIPLGSEGRGCQLTGAVGWRLLAGSVVEEVVVPFEREKRVFLAT